jgi:hypothetical protein
MQSPRGAVLTVLGHHLGRPTSTIHPWQDLEHDLEMTPLEVVLMALEVEGIEDADLDVTGLERVHTVGELVSFFTREIARARLARADLDVA